MVRHGIDDVAIAESWQKQQQAPELGEYGLGAWARRRIVGAVDGLAQENAAGGLGQPGSRGTQCLVGAAVADDCHRRTVAQHGVGSGLLDAEEGADCLQQHAAREAGMVRGGAEIEVEHLQRRWALCCDCGDG